MDRDELALELLVEGRRRLRHAGLAWCRRRAGPASLPQWPASRERTQAGQRLGLSNGYLLSGDRGAARTGAARVSRSAHATRRATSKSRSAYKGLRKHVTSVTDRDNVDEAAGQRFEPQLPGPEEALCLAAYAAISSTVMPKSGLASRLRSGLRIPADSGRFGPFGHYNVLVRKRGSRRRQCVRQRRLAYAGSRRSQAQQR